ncbi:MAG: DnaB-like helicase C-terminal domain-containing protein [Peptostreptococcaceae bacterium]
MLAAVEIEQSVIGSLIVDSSNIKFIEDLKEEFFTVNAHKEIYKKMKQLSEKNSEIDILTLHNNLDKDEIQLSYITQLTAVAQVYAIKSHIEILKEKYKRRNIVNNIQQLAEQVTNDADLNTVVYNFESEVKKIVDSDSKVDDDSFSIADKFLEFLYSSKNTNKKFGIEFLDKTIGGLHDGELTTIAAKSGVGKTALALQIIRAVLNQNKKVLLISREMSDVQVFMRNITSLTGISSMKMKNKDFTPEEEAAITKAVMQLTNNNGLYINDNISKVPEIKKRIRQVRPDLVVIDYLQLLSPDKSQNNREREVATLSREIKNMTLDFNIPIIQLSQLNDELKDFRPKGERPMRDSKAIYHDSNNVIYIHEPVGKDLEDACEANSLEVKQVKAAKLNQCTLVDLIVDKCRDGGKAIEQHWYAGKRLYFQQCIGGALKESYKKQYKPNSKTYR